MRTGFLCISVLRVASGPRVKLGSCKSALNPPPPHPPVVFLYRPFCGDPSVSLTPCCFEVYSTICCMSFRVSFCACVFQSF